MKPFPRVVHLFFFPYEDFLFNVFGVDLLLNMGADTAMAFFCFCRILILLWSLCRLHLRLHNMPDHLLHLHLQRHLLMQMNKFVHGTQVNLLCLIFLTFQFILHEMRWALFLLTKNHLIMCIRIGSSNLWAICYDRCKPKLSALGSADNSVFSQCLGKIIFSSCSFLLLFHNS